MLSGIRSLIGRACLVLLGAAVAAPHWLPIPVLAQSLPTILLDTTYVPPTTGIITTVNAGGNLQAALNQALPGDIIELQAGATFTGNFRLPYKSGTGWIYIRSSAYASLPSPGTRVSPAKANLMPKIVTPNTAAAITTDAAAHHYRFVGIEITGTQATTASTLYNLVWLEAQGGQVSLSQVPTDIVFDRCYLHGTPTGNVRRGIAVNSARTAIIDSYLSDFHEVGVDSQAILGWNGPGPFKIVNNYLEGAGENVMFGGVDPQILNLVPSDIEIRHNYFFKPLSWRIGDPSYNGTQWSIKNIFELKNARRVLIDGNIFEHNWPNAQNGFSILFTVRNQNGTAPWSVVEDVTFTNNILRHAAQGINILGRDDNYLSQQTKRILIKNNLFDDLGGAWGGGRLLQLLSGTADVTFDHNTAFQTENIIFADGALSTGMVFRNNIAPHNEYGVAGTGTGIGLTTLTVYFPGYIFAKNVLPGGNLSLYPLGNFFPVSLNDVGFENLAGGNYRLAPSSPYKNGGTDGKDPGADVDALAAATAGVLSGASSASSATVPGVIEAEAFDTGGEGIGYHDNVPGNSGGVYRTTEDVDIIASSDSAGGNYVIWNFDTGEWMAYTINVSQAGFYRIDARVSSGSTDSAYHVEIDNINVTGSVTVPNTGGWTTFQDVGKGGINLSQGQHVLKIYSDQQYFNLNWMRLSAEAGPTPPTVSITEPAQGVTISGTIMVTANASDNLGIASVQFRVDGTNLGGEDVSPPYSVSWDTTTVPNGSHLLTAVARNDAGISTTSSAISVTVNNDTTAPVLSAVAASGLSSSAETITWTTNEPADSQVEYGPTTAYGQAATLNSTLVTSHSVALSGLSASTLYHYRVKSKDAAGNLAVSTDFTFTTSAAAGTRSPFRGVPFSVPGLIEAEDFDNGGEGVAYHDLVTGNAGGLYRLTEDVDIVANGTGYAVNNIQTGEWLSYTITVAQAGTYRLEASVSSTFTTSRWHVEIDGVDRTGSILVPSTGSWGTFQSIGKSGVSLAAGQHILKIYSEQEYFNLDALRLLAEDTAPPTISAVAASGITSSAATITWTTDEASDSQVEYGSTTAYGSATALSTSLVTAHAETLSGLTASTLYHYRVKSRDAAGNLTVSADFTFTTLAPPPPIVDTGLRGPIANTPVTSSAGDNNGFQSNPANAHADDGLFAVDTNSGSGSSASCTSSSKDKHLFSNYGFSIPAGSTIKGIEVRLDAKVDSTSGSPKLCVQLSWDGGTTWTSAKATPTLTTSEATYILGSATDPWGRSWTVGNLADTSFRVRVISVANSTSRDFSLDWLAVRVTYQQ